MELTERRGAQSDGTGYEIKMAARGVRDENGYERGGEFRKDGIEDSREEQMQPATEIEMPRIGAAVVPLHHRRSRSIVDGTFRRVGVMMAGAGIMPVSVILVKMSQRILIEHVLYPGKQPVVMMVRHDRMSQYDNTGQHD